MSMPKISNGQAQIILGVAGLGVALAALYYTKKQVTDGLNAVNPVNDDNVINKAVNSLFGFDNKTESIGTKMYDVLNPAESNVKKQITTARNPAKVAKPYESKTTPLEAQKLVAPFLASTDFRFYELKPK